MPNNKNLQKQDIFAEQLKKGFDAMAPDGDAKQRMYQNILQRESQPVTSKRNFTFRFPVWMGTAAVACAVLAFAGVYNNMTDCRKDAIPVETPVISETTTVAQTEMDATETTTAFTSMMESTTVTTISTQLKQVVTQMETESTETVDETVLTWENTTVTTQRDRKNILRNNSSETTTQAASQAAQTVHQPNGERKTQATTAVTQSTKEHCQTTTGTVQTTTMPAVTTMVTTIGEKPTITEETEKTYRYVDKFYDLTWQGINYVAANTCEISNVGELLGNSVTTGKETTETCTVLIYTLKDTAPEDAVVVQYKDEDDYYIFYAEK